MSIFHRCHPILVAFEWELTKETIHLPLGCLQGGAGAARLARCAKGGVLDQARDQRWLGGWGGGVRCPVNWGGGGDGGGGGGGVGVGVGGRVGVGEEEVAAGDERLGHCLACGRHRLRTWHI